jgi:predicted ribosome quality control (RQC) complex YloA/Tae2 family protein
VKTEWEPFVDRRRKLAWNIEQCFNKARETEGKILGTEKRLEILNREIEDLETGKTVSGTRPQVNTAAVAAVAKSDAQRRTLKLTEELTATMGKSAGDNLKLLRQARAWDYWMHLRDQPSSHLIIFRNKGAKVSDAHFHQAAEWFVRQQLGAKAARHAGEKFAIVIAECRHVHPIKGDKIGRVTFRDERLLMYQFPG